ncbi:hypothetical protein [Bacillus amyloliquefaciens]|uniref:hypothetical protein n=1 Tax=Bacillus amyloliquefaciens TaxID=1390 RepID=UPI000206EC5F|nr:hypothetical protein [Bacillus amyloliquefaciens]AEB63454.1 hypothetical protein LL3_01915 [Bacillus amyloliquefaciens LL3]MEC1013398.1 hypothetical protein [Bacillus amyloliquefaciens]
MKIIIIGGPQTFPKSFGVSSEIRGVGGGIILFQPDLNFLKKTLKKPKGFYNIKSS